jgi:hypothetical protein
LAILRHLDLVVLALALPVFVAAELPMLGYVVAAAAWLIQKAVFAVARQRTQGALAEGNRNLALGTLAGATLGRVWIVTLAILLVGLLAERADGLAAAVLSAVLVTVHLATEAIARLIEPEPS